MKINLLSDIHLEFAPLDLLGGEILLLAGDITVGDTLRPERTDSCANHVRSVTKEFFDQASLKYQHVFYIPGNHEFYHGDIHDTVPVLRRFVSQYPNVTFLYNSSEELSSNIRIFGATAWTDMNKSDPLALNAARMGMNDFYQIENKINPKGKLTPEDTVAEHALTLQKLKMELEKYPDKDFLVMWHHCPTFKSVHPKYGNDQLNHAFSSNNSDFILDNPQIKWFVHGHTHDSFDYMVGDCRVMCNPRGYTSWIHYKQNKPSENEAFDINFSFGVN